MAENAALGLGLSKRRLLEVMQDGRVAAHFAEAWLDEDIWDIPSEVLEAVQDGRARVRVLTKQVRFQDSKQMGVGRSCTPEQLTEAVGRFECFVIFDMEIFPRVKVHLIPGSVVNDWAQKGLLKVAGIPRSTFYHLLAMEDRK